MLLLQSQARPRRAFGEVSKIFSTADLQARLAAAQAARNELWYLGYLPEQLAQVDAALAELGRMVGMFVGASVSPSVADDDRFTSALTTVASALKDTAALGAGGPPRPRPAGAGGDTGGLLLKLAAGFGLAKVLGLI